MSVSLGVLAGMGPRSTAPFIDMLVTDCQVVCGAKYDMDFPEMHIISLPTPFWPGKKINGSEMIAALQHGIAELVKADVSLIAVPCNLAHCYFDEMNEASAGIPLLHIADSALEALPAEAGKVAILATEPTHEAGFYQQRIRDSGREVIDSQELRSTTTSLIGLVKAKGFRDPEVQARWHNLMSMVGSTQADAVLIACTDLSPLISRNSFNFAIVDTATSLSRATIRHYRRLIEEKNDSGAAR